jgi:MraZ protein
MYFRGNFDHALQANGRVSLPSRWRKALEEDNGNKVLVLVPEGDRIAVYPDHVYQRKEKADMKLSQRKQPVRQQMLKEYSDVSEQELDAAGRLLIPDSYRKKFGLEKAITLQGFSEMMYIYNPEVYRKQLELAEANEEGNQQYVMTLQEGSPVGESEGGGEKGRE